MLTRVFWVAASDPIRKWERAVAKALTAPRRGQWWVDVGSIRVSEGQTLLSSRERAERASVRRRQLLQLPTTTSYYYYCQLP